MSAKEAYISKQAGFFHKIRKMFGGKTISNKTHEEAVALANKPVKKILPLEEDAYKNVSRNKTTPISDAPKLQESTGIGPHFKKHWPGYAAAGAAGVIGASYLKGKNDKQTSVPAQTV